MTVIAMVVIVVMIVIVAMIVVMIVVFMAVMVMTVIVVMVVVVIVPVMVSGEPQVAVPLHRLQQLFHRHLLLRRLGLLDNVVDHFVLENRRPQLGQRRRALLIVLVDELLL